MEAFPLLILLALVMLYWLGYVVVRYFRDLGPSAKAAFASEDLDETIANVERTFAFGDIMLLAMSGDDEISNDELAQLRDNLDRTGIELTTEEVIERVKLRRSEIDTPEQLSAALATCAEQLGDEESRELAFKLVVALVHAGSRLDRGRAVAHEGRLGYRGASGDEQLLLPTFGDALGIDPVRQQELEVEPLEPR